MTYSMHGQGGGRREDARWWGHEPVPSYVVC